MQPCSKLQSANNNWDEGTSKIGVPLLPRFSSHFSDTFSSINEIHTADVNNSDIGEHCYVNLICFSCTAKMSGNNFILRKHKTRETSVNKVGHQKSGKCEKGWKWSQLSPVEGYFRPITFLYFLFPTQHLYLVDRVFGTPFGRHVWCKADHQ